MLVQQPVSAGESSASASGAASRRQVVMASIGTVLIDAFDTPPRPTGSSSTSPRPLPLLRSASNALTIPSPSGPSHSAIHPTSPTLPAPHAQNRRATHPSLPATLRDSPHDSPSPPIASTSTSPFPLPIPDTQRLPLPRADLDPSSLRSPSSSISTSTNPPSGFLPPQLSLSSPTPSPAEVYETLGGGGLYALIGARLWLGANQLATLVDREQRRTDGSGGDLPRRLEKELEGCGRDMWVWNEGKGTRMTRARIRYEGDVRLYQHIVKAPYRPLSSLLHTPLALAEYLHVSPPYSPEDLHGLLVELDAQNDLGDESNSDLGDKSNRPWRPKIVFEPTPPSCHAGQKEWLEKILGGIEVLSPNHEELLSFYSVPPIPPTNPALLPMMERLIVHLLSLGVGPDGSGTVVVRCGRLGCVVGTREGGVRWIPAYWAAQDEGRVKDVTGGNSFLGGYISGLSLSSGDPYEAALYATVSASFVVEQFGLPVLNPEAERRSQPDPSDGEEQGDGGVHERWNGDSAWNRLVSLRARLGVA